MCISELGGKLLTACYEIRIKDHLSQQWVEWFDGLEIFNHPNGEATLSSKVIDQAALFGIIDKVRDLNLTLLEVKRID